MALSPADVARLTQLARIDLTDDELARLAPQLDVILDAVASGTTLRPQPDDLQSVQAFLVENQLLVPDGESGSAALAER